MDNEQKRALIAVAVFLVIFYLSPLLMKYDYYDIRIEAVRLVSAVLGTGCYWIGSNKK